MEITSNSISALAKFSFLNDEDKITIDLVIPCYNNSLELLKELPPLMDYFYTQKLDVNVIIVDDGSTTKEGLVTFCNKHSILLITQPKNQGKGAAIRLGMKHSTSEIVVFTDADIPFEYGIFEEIIFAFKNPQIQIVCGNRSNKDYYSKTTWMRNHGSKFFSLLVNGIMQLNMGDTQCGVKGFRKNLAKYIVDVGFINGFAADIEWIHISKIKGYEIKWVNAVFRNAGKSSVVMWKEALIMIIDAIKIKMKYHFKKI